MDIKALNKRIEDIRTVPRLWDGRLYENGTLYVCLLYNAEYEYWVKRSEMTGEMATHVLYEGKDLNEAIKVYESIK